MSVTRNNHYVPQWHQTRFLPSGGNTLFYLDLQPTIHNRGDGTPVAGKSLFHTPPVRAFCTRDLYSTFFETDVDDEIERRLFGDIDARGADAIRAFSGTDQTAWHDNFESLFQYLDIQKLRTPKGLSWLQTQYPELSQNELMQEMQSIRMLNVATWTTGVREIVSAENSPTKFILTDHPVTIYNHAAPPRDPRNDFPGDPSIALKASQTIYPLGPDHCLILTNLEYAKDPSTNPLEKRTFARSFQRALVSTIDFIHTRHLTESQVIEINFIAKSRAKRYIAAGQREWLFPETSVMKPWRDLRTTLLPPEDELFHFGGEMYVGYEGGRVHYQDQFGREEEPRPWLTKTLPEASPKNRNSCPCGSGLKFSHCCKLKPAHLRTSWSERSIRERNVMLMRGIENLLELDGKDWNDVRSEMTDEKISTLYRIYESLWPRETDLLSLLPKPDGTFRSVYTGSLHPKLINEFALGAVLYFGEIIIQHPFINPMSLREEMRPTQDPGAYRGEVLKSLMTFLSVYPLVEQGLVHLVPDPWDFDLHLRDQTMSMAEARRIGIRFNRGSDPRLDAIVQEDMQRTFMGLPDEALLSQLAKVPDIDPSVSPGDFIEHVREMRRRDPLAVLQENSLGKGGQLELMKMAPNFEMSMYLAQATGAQILTDSPFRWRELQGALNRRHLGVAPALEELRTTIGSSPIRFPLGFSPLAQLKSGGAFDGVSSVFSSAYRYLHKTRPGAAKPNFEAHLVTRFERGKRLADAAIESVKIPHMLGKVSSIFRLGGLQDNTINRLLLMSSSEHHLQSVPMATYISRWPHGEQN
ncbi:DUF4238 domain-containing protein [Rhizobium sp. CECT 9324]|uniref:DUF4238 domain-containing protein n=1 Tax=Rhizobium sp. CECT 9324 TaxID=2845820 RepID=UPI001E5E73AD|nr:DUF4238 domain-containing protein [Rhizobium sp. CECT 9324]CAH0340491.1 hypothetical protein RHI9324_02159 [Rhizobium sp. CECT 9324]